MNATWHELWKARIGESLSAAEVELWEDELRNEIRSLSSNEVIAAIRAIGDAKRRGEIKYKPTLNHLISAIIKARYDERNGGNQLASQTRHEENINRLKAKVRSLWQAGRKVEAWEAICDYNGDLRDMVAVEDWATEVLGFERPTLAEMGIVPFRDVIKYAESGAGLQKEVLA